MILTLQRGLTRELLMMQNIKRKQDEMGCMFYMTRDIYDIQVRNKEAASNYDLLLKYYDSVNNSSMQTAVLNNVAKIHDDKGEYNEAISIYNKNLEIKKRLGDQRDIAGTLTNIGMIYYKKGEYDKAMELYNQSLEISRKIENQNLLTTTLNNMSHILILKEDNEQALSHVLEAHEILQRLMTPELQRSLDILDNIKSKLGTEAFERLVEKVQKQDLS